MTLEIRQAARRLVRSPAFTLAAVSTLALAIGANTSIFAVVQRVVLNPLPYPEADRLIELDHGALGLRVNAGMGLTQGLYFHYVERSRMIEGAAVYQASDQTLVGDGEPERIRVASATPSLASVLRVSPVVGRWFRDQEGVLGAPQVAVLSHGLWVRRYGSAANIIGRAVVLGGVPTEVIGVMPASFTFPDPRVGMWVAERISRSTGFGLWDYDGVARLRDGVTLEDARAELQGLIRDLAVAYPNDPRALGNMQSKLVFTGQTLKDATIGNIARALWILLASAGLVLLVACANVANLFLVRSEARQREVAVRRALGAGRFGIARFFLTESVLLAGASGALGLALASGAVQLVVGFAPANLPRLDEIRLDGVALAFTAGLSLLAAFAFGSMPLWRRPDQVAPLHETGRGNTASRQRHHARHLLMGTQVAMALVLLIASGLMVRSFLKLRALDPGFDPSSALTFSIGLPEGDYRTRDAAVAAHHTIVDRLSALPGVRSVSTSTCLPLTGACNGNTVKVEGRTYPDGTIPPLALLRAVGGGYFETMGVRLVRGTVISRSDVERREPVAVVNEAFASRNFADEDPIGKRIASNVPPVREGDFSNLKWLTIVGVVANTPTRTLGENPLPQVFMPISVARGPDVPSTEMIGPHVSAMSYVVRTVTPPRDLLPSVRSAVAAFDRNLALAQVSTAQDTLDRASAQMAFTMVLLAIASSVALMLGAIGIYGVMSYVVSQRTGEIGVRLALGAEPSSVAGAIVWQGALVSLAGIVVGLGAAFAGSRLIESLLYGVSARDSSVFVATTLGVMGVTLVACWLPARRAARLSPLEALRIE